MAKPKEPFSKPIEVVKEPFAFEKELPFCTDYGTLLQIGTFDLFYKFDASYIALLEITPDLYKFTVPSVELMMPSDRLLTTLKNSGLHPDDIELGNKYLIDLLTERAIWNVKFGFPEAPEHFHSVPTEYSNNVLSILMAGYGGDIVKTDSEGFYQQVAYLKYKMSTLSEGGTSLFGVRLLMRGWLHKMGMDIPDTILERYQTYFEPSGSVKSSWVPSGAQMKEVTEAFASYDIDMSEVPLDDIIDADFLEEEEELYDGRVNLSLLLTSHPSKWAMPQARVQVIPDIDLSFAVSKIICRDQMLFFHLEEEFKMSPLLVAKELGIPNTYAQHIMLV
jgi:hypothetical protein